MKNINQHIEDLITDFSSGNIDREGKKELNEWIAKSEKNRKYFMQHQELWFSALQEQESESYNYESAFLQFKKRVAATHPAANKKRIIVPHWRNLLRYAAMVALISIIADFSYHQGKNNLRDALTDIEMKAPLGAQAQMRLPDGTLVVLNAGSCITYPQDFGVDNRVVKLQGEGYFEVAHNAEKPFYVYSESLQVHVLGTKFNFRDYTEDETAVVSLLEGKVALHNNKEVERYLAPKERATVNKKDGLIQIEKTEQICRDIQWKNGKLTFDEIPLPLLIRRLERSYGVHIVLKNETLSSYCFYGNFDRTQQNIKEVLEVLKATGKIHYTLKDKEIVLY